MFKKWPVFLLLLFSLHSYSQTLTLKEAIELCVSNYGTIKAKSKYLAAAKETFKQVKADYLPNVTLSAQQDYGTVNGQNGPLYGFGGYGVSSSGLPLPKQNWNAAFGALYLINVNWEVFSFGRIRERVNLSKVESERYSRDLDQEIFQQKIKIAAAYLNLLVNQRLIVSQEKNLERAIVFHSIAATRVKNGLLAGVDSTLTYAEVSRAVIALNQLKDRAKEENNKLVALMGVGIENFVLDSSFVKRVPKAILSNPVTLNPVLQYYKSRVDVGKQSLKLYKREYYPTVNLIGIYQTRGSGFSADYATNQHAFSQNYLDGINPSRQNYLFGVGLTWNLTSIAKTGKKVNAQQYTVSGLQDEYDVVDQQLKTQLDAAEAKVKFALENYNEAPKQVRAARQAYLQKTTLYKNGLTNLVDVTQALYALNRAEIDSDIIYTNVWQSLLMKAAAYGDFALFINEF
ncbi:TolC family protein [Pedobacter nyackensis]|uniref:TolC family protein n=1 Tax=Pedobacter nyackensis TaxID=475255 RepID=UPI00292E9DFF|nr:TolC family protein [Pedobacter nyackensis]